MGLDVYNNSNDTIVKVVGNGGTSGIVYLPRRFTGCQVKIIIPAESGTIDEIIPKKVGHHKICGVIYVHKKHLGKSIKIIFPEKINDVGEDVPA